MTSQQSACNFKITQQYCFITFYMRLVVNIKDIMTCRSVQSSTSITCDRTNQTVAAGIYRIELYNKSEMLLLGCIL